MAIASVPSKLRGMVVRIDVTASDDPAAGQILDSAPLIGVDRLVGCTVTRVHHVRGELSDADLVRLCAEVLVDPVVDVHTIDAPARAGGRVVEVAPRPGVTDGEARELEHAAFELGFAAIEVSTARRYELHGDLSDDDVARLTRRLLANDTIEHACEGEMDPEFAGAIAADVRVDLVELDGLSDDALAQMSRERVLSLDVNEMRAIQAHFVAEGRWPRT